MPVKMVVTDLDGTLLRSDGTISEYTAGILGKCRGKGLKVVFATARPKRAVTHLLARVPVDALAVHNGAVVYVGDRLFASHGIVSEIKSAVLRSICREYPDAALSVEIDDVIYANHNVAVVWEGVLGILTDFSDLPDRPADKIIVGVKGTDDMARYSKYLPSDLYMEMSSGRLGLIMSRAATKWNAVQALAEHFGVPIGEIVAFGDEYNDIEMIQNCGLGIAVKNALDGVKAVADHVSGTNDEDGVAKWLEENVFGAVGAASSCTV